MKITGVARLILDGSFPGYATPSDHSLVLMEGGLPLPVAEMVVDAWLSGVILAVPFALSTVG